MKKTDCKKSIVAALGMSLCLTGLSASVQAASDTGSEYIGSVEYVAFNFVPRDYASCDGQLLSIASNQTLYSLLGDIYGGDGRTTFGLPDMRGRVPIHAGTGPGLPGYVMGQRSGYPTTTLQVANLAAHKHNVAATSVSTSVLNAVNTGGDNKRPVGNAIAQSSTGDFNFSTTTPAVAMNGDSVVTNTTTTVIEDNMGSGQAFSIMQPYTVLRCIIATEGLYPPRS